MRSDRASVLMGCRVTHVGAAKATADFDWAWPKKIDRQAVEELFTLACIETGHDAVLVGPNGKTMVLKNIALHALSRGHTVRFVTASEMLAELAGRDSSAGLSRRHAACVVTLVDRLIHRAEVIDTEADSYHLKEAKGAHRRPRQPEKPKQPPS